MQDLTVWTQRYLQTLNIDRDILSMKNFNVYDPMKRGQGLVLDGQTLAHIEVCISIMSISVLSTLTFLAGSTKQRRQRRGYAASAAQPLHYPFRSGFDWSVSSQRRLTRSDRQASVPHLALYASSPNLRHQRTSRCCSRSP